MEGFVDKENRLTGRRWVKALWATSVKTGIKRSESRETDITSERRQLVQIIGLWGAGSKFYSPAVKPRQREKIVRCVGSWV